MVMFGIGHEIEWLAMEATGQARMSLAAECDSAETSGKRRE